MNRDGETQPAKHRVKEEFKVSRVMLRIIVTDTSQKIALMIERVFSKPAIQQRPHLGPLRTRGPVEIVKVALGILRMPFVRPLEIVEDSHGHRVAHLAALENAGLDRLARVRVGEHGQMRATALEVVRIDQSWTRG